MDTPESPQASPALRAREVLRALVQKGGRRQLLLLFLFVVLVAMAGRSGTAGPATTHAEAHAPAGRVHPPITSDLALAQSGRQSPEALAVDNLLSRYDALIRLVETRALDHPGQPAPAELDDLRALRARLYEITRRALSSAAPLDTTSD